MAKIPSETGETIRLERLLKKIRGSSFLFLETDSRGGGEVKKNLTPPSSRLEKARGSWFSWRNREVPRREKRPTSGKKHNCVLVPMTRTRFKLLAAQLARSNENEQGSRTVESLGDSREHASFRAAVSRVQTDEGAVLSLQLTAVFRRSCQANRGFLARKTNDR